MNNIHSYGVDKRASTWTTLQILVASDHIWTSMSVCRICDSSKLKTTRVPNFVLFLLSNIPKLWLTYNIYRHIHAIANYGDVVLARIWTICI